MKRIMAMAGAVLVLAACTDKGKVNMATGTFEATETTVSAQQTGTLLALSISEGDNISAGQEVGLIDTTQLWLSIRQLEAQKAVFQSQKPDMQKQIAATRQQLATARQEQQRYQELVSDGAAPSKALDDATSQVLVLQRQLDAQISALNTTTQTLDRQTEAADVQAAQLRDQLAKCHITVPAGGSVLEKYVEPGEFVTTGKPLFKVADTGHMFLRAYVTSGQLKDVTLGQQVTVYADYGGGERHEYEGTVSWISSRSEFTPKTILTDDERADLVYAVKVAIRNDGYVKIGMYGEVVFGLTPTPSPEGEGSK